MVGPGGLLVVGPGGLLVVGGSRWATVIRGWAEVSMTRMQINLVTHRGYLKNIVLLEFVYVMNNNSLLSNREMCTTYK